MKRHFAVIAALALFAGAAAAQGVPRAEAFLGYTYVRANSATNIPAFSANGGGGQFDVNFGKWVGFVADIGAVHNGNIGGAHLDSTFSNFLFGPRLNLHYGRIHPYVQILWGGVAMASSARVSLVNAAPVFPSQPIVVPPTPVQPIAPTTPVNPSGAVTARIGTNQTAFAMTVGGGLDIRINRHVSFRPIGLDYYLTRLQNLRSQNDNNQNNLRYTTGFNFLFGGAR